MKLKRLLFALPALFALLLGSAPALADLVQPTVLSNSDFEIWLAAGIALIALALLVFVVIRIRRKRK